MSINNNKKKERIGVTNVNNQGLIMKVIDYKNTHHVSILFEDGSIVNTEWRSFENGTVRNLNYPITRNKGKKTNRKGEENINHQGCVMRIIQYNNANDLMVQFDDNSDHISKCSYKNFKIGKVDNPFIPSVFNVGIIGNEAPCMDGNKKIKEYCCWIGMLKRCYEEVKSIKNITYEDCWVDDEFLYYPNFYKWIRTQDNYKVWRDTPNFALDKDILCKGNKIYAPDKCCLVPNRINNLIKLGDGNRGKYVIGVTKNLYGQYVAQCWNGLEKKNKCLGTYNNEYDAFLAYKHYKEKLIKETAEIEYKNGIITKACRDALFNYEVEITD